MANDRCFDHVTLDGLRAQAERAAYAAHRNPLAGRGAGEALTASWVAFLDDSEPALDASDGVDAEQGVRTLRLLYYVIQDLVDGRRLPHWASASREQGARLFSR